MSFVVREALCLRMMVWLWKLRIVLIIDLLIVVVILESVHLSSVTLLELVLEIHAFLRLIFRLRVFVLRGRVLVLRVISLDLLSHLSIRIIEVMALICISLNVVAILL
jgi:hypothetical protein